MSTRFMDNVKEASVLYQSDYMSGAIGNVIISGYRDDNPDDARRETARHNTNSFRTDVTYS